jgi:hypothetical protein
VALAALAGREPEVAALLKQIATESPLRLFWVLKLTSVAARSRDESRRAIAAIQLAAIDLLKPSLPQLNAEERLALDRIEAAALAAAGRRDEAVVAYAKLNEADADDAAILTAYASLLLDSTDPHQLERALGLWRAIAARSKPRSPDWQQAKYSVALAQFRLGDRAASAALLRYILETPPGLAGSPWEARYNDLLKRCQP